MRLIDADNAIIENCRRCDLKDRCEECFIRQMFEEQPTINDWIPTSERLPDLRELDAEFEDFTKMLLTTDGTDFDIAWFDISEQIWESNGTGFVVEPSKIIAWMPIPTYEVNND